MTWSKTTPMAGDRLRGDKDAGSPPISVETFEKLYALLDRAYPGKVWRVVEVCPVAVVKTIDNEHDAQETIANIERGIVEGRIK